MPTTPLFVYGKQPCIEVMSRHPEIVDHVFVLGTLDASLQSSFRQTAKSHRIPFRVMDKKSFKNLVSGEHHQGVACRIREFPYTDFNSWIDDLDLDSNPVVFMLDEVQDPHNVGAIIRSAAGFSASGVLLPKHNQAHVTESVIRTSAGTIFSVPVIDIGNVADTLRRLKESRFWIASLTADGDTNLRSYVHDSPLVVVIGSEGSGVRRQTLDLSDFQFRIDISPDVESLNASVSAGIAAYHLCG